MPEIWFPNLGIEIQKLDKTAFSLFNIEIRWYAIFITSAIALGLFLVLKEALRTNQNKDDYYDFLNFALIGAIIGARVYYVIFEWDEFNGDIFKIINIRNGGLAIYGGIIGAVLVAIIFTKKRKLKLSLFLDTSAPYLALGQAIGRIGNFFNREVFGGYTNSLFAMRYKLEQVESPISKEIIDNIININGTDYIQVQPTFLYEAICTLLIFIILIIYRPYKKFDGEITALYFFCYGIARAWIEGIRTDQLYIMNTSIPVSQILSIIFSLIALVYLVYNYRKVYKNKI